MSKFDKQIVCVNTKELLGKDYFQGFAPASEKHYWQRIMDCMHARRRGDVEEDPTVKQVIGYAMVVHMPSKTVLAYQRSTDATKYTETRAYGNWSWGVGGHMEMVDTGTDPVTASLRRELAEDFGLV